MWCPVTATVLNVMGMSELTCVYVHCILWKYMYVHCGCEWLARNCMSFGTYYLSKAHVCMTLCVTSKPFQYWTISSIAISPYSHIMLLNEANQREVKQLNHHFYCILHSLVYIPKIVIVKINCDLFAQVWHHHWHWFKALAHWGTLSYTRYTQ